MAGFLEGTTGVVLGVANKRSIAWACARALSRQGMRVALTFGDERLEEGVRALAAQLPSAPVHFCDVTLPGSIEALFERLQEELGQLDALVHGVAFAKRDELGLPFHQTSWEGYRVAHEVSTYSLVALARAALSMMEGRAASIVSLSYIGAERVIPSYDVMGVAKAALESAVRYLASDLGPRGIRVNAISAGPIRTISSAVIPGMHAIYEHMAARAPLRRNVSADEVGDACAFLCSQLARGITGSTLYVDAGYHAMGV